MPEELQVEVPEGGDVYWTAFWRLHRGRTYAGGMVPFPNPLPLADIVGYARSFDLDIEETVTLVQLMDATWMEHQAKVAKRQHERREAQKKE